MGRIKTRKPCFWRVQGKGRWKMKRVLIWGILHLIQVYRSWQGQEGAPKTAEHPLDAAAQLRWPQTWRSSRCPRHMGITCPVSASRLSSDPGSRDTRRPSRQKQDPGMHSLFLPSKGQTGPKEDAGVWCWCGSEGAPGPRSATPAVCRLSLWSHESHFGAPVESALETPRLKG